MERYDRKRDPGGGVLRLHQEDFCQALGILPDQKYESEGGPKLSQCFLLLRDYSTRPAADQRSLLSWVIFNAFIGNADAHAKNLAILYDEKGPRLAPFYDLLCTQVYPDLAEKYAMKIGGENRPDWLQLRHWERLADELSLKKRFVLDMIQRMTGTIIIEAEKLAEDFQRETGRQSNYRRDTGSDQKAGRQPAMTIADLCLLRSLGNSGDTLQILLLGSGFR